MSISRCGLSLCGISLGARRQCSIAIVLGFCTWISGASFACAADAVGEAVVGNPVERQPIGQLSATVERPLFSPTRRPPAKPVAVVNRPEPPPTPAPPPSVVLLGIVREGGDGRAAIRQSGDKVVRVRMGDDVEGWKVERIEPRRLVLTLGERSVDFAMFNGGAAKGARSAVAKAVERRMRQVRTPPSSD